ncbi:unnamed protein product [Caenorhabditis bovis]|uniref:Uncharacterized protein n=1 Tax=Caenorhabditis bovis TaxID=2654633 RepID=A0A8S1ESJ8_9PELO|nr:unnamed protein product [Caenorhabditis bovis]
MGFIHGLTLLLFAAVLVAGFPVGNHDDKSTEGSIDDDDRVKRHTDSGEKTLEAMDLVHGIHKRSDEHHEPHRRHAEHHSGVPDNHHIDKRGEHHSDASPSRRLTRSTDQGHDEDELDDVVDDGDEEEEEEERDRRSLDEPLPTFASDVDDNAAKSVAVRVKRVSRAGSSHKARNFSKNRGNSKAGNANDNSNQPLDTSFNVLRTTNQ